MGAALALLTFAAAEVARADDFQLWPAVAVSEEYNDNVFFSSSNSRSSFITTLSGGVDVLESTERLAAKLNIRIDGLLYSADSELNGVEQRYRGQASYLLTPLLKVGGSAAFSKESRPDRYIETSGLVVRQDSTHQEYTLVADATFTEKAAGQLAYLYGWADYHDPSVSNFEGHSVKGAVMYDLGTFVPMLKARAVAGYNTYHYSLSDIDNYSITGGVSYPIHELWSIQGDIGGRFTQSEFTSESPGGRVRHSSDDAGWVASIIGSYRGEKDAASLALNRDIINAPGRSGAAESMAVTLKVSRRFTYELSGAIGTAYHWNYSDAGQFAEHAIDVRTFRVRPTLHYDINRFLAADLLYEFALVRDRQADTEAHRSKIFLSLSFQKPIIE